MEHEHQRRYYDLGRSYWWLAGKYRIIDDVVGRLSPVLPSPARILDLGCGPGNLLDFLRPRGDIYGSDYSADALGFCLDRGYRRLFRADFHSLPISSESFDLVTCIDVVEHLKDDRRALQELHRILRPTGRLVLSVPAFQALWGDHDTLYGHYRRYTTSEVREKLAEAGFEVLRCTYFEPLFFLPLLVYRRLKKLLVKEGGLEGRDDFVSLPGLLNAFLAQMIAAERFVLRVVDLPVGVTLLAVARKAARTSAP